MKYIYILLVGLLSVQIFYSDLEAIKPANKEENAKNSSIVSKAVVVPEKPKTWAELTREEKIASTSCDLTTEILYESDGSCYPKILSPTTLADTVIVASGSCEEAVRRIFPSNEVENALKVMRYESSGGITAIHNYNTSTGDDSYGCFQINLAGNNYLTRPSASELANADINVTYAYKLWSSTGWCSTGGWINTGRKVGICL